MITKKMILITIIVLLTTLPISLATNNTCEPKVLNKKCAGNYLLLQIQNSDCSVRWKIGYFCPYGCAYGDCLNEKTLPVLLVKNRYVVNDENSLIVFSIHNIGTRGTIKLSVEGNASQWIDIPEEVTLEPNETKNIIAVVNPPHGLKGAYTFTIHAKGSLDYYAPSVLVLSPSTHAVFTGTYHDANIWFSVIIVAILAVVFAYFTKKGNVKKEESF